MTRENVNTRKLKFDWDWSRIGKFSQHVGKFKNANTWKLESDSAMHRAPGERDDRLATIVLQSDEIGS